MRHGTIAQTLAFMLPDEKASEKKNSFIVKRIIFEKVLKLKWSNLTTLERFEYE